MRNQNPKMNSGVGWGWWWGLSYFSYGVVFALKSSLKYVWGLYVRRLYIPLIADGFSRCEASSIPSV